MSRRKPPAGVLGRWMAHMLASRNMNRTDLAERMGVDPSMVSKWLRGVRMPNVPHCQAIARAFGVPDYEVLRLADHVPEHLRQPTAHPERDRAHALIDLMDPEVVALYIPLMERHLAIAAAAHE